MQEEYLLSIGAGKEQVASILKAKKLGFKVIAVDKYSDAPGMELADLAIHIDIKKTDEIIEVLEEYSVSGIIPSPIGRYLTTIGRINDYFGLSGISEKAAMRCVDKLLFNETLKSVFPMRADFKLVRDQEEYLEVIKKKSFPIILKPRYGSGSREVFALFDVNEALECATKVNFANGDYLIEELVVGEEYGVDGVVRNKKFELVLVREKELTEYPYRQALATNAPAKLNVDMLAKITNHLKKCIEEIELDNCLLHVDLIIDRQGEIHVIELAGRPAGLFISSQIVPFVTGVDYLKEGILLCGDKTNDFRKKWEPRPISFRFINKTFSENEITELKANNNIVDFSNFQFIPARYIKDGHDVMGINYVMSTGINLGEAIETTKTFL